MAEKSVRKQIRESLEAQMRVKLGLAGEEKLPPEIRDQLDSYIRLFDRRKSLQALLTNKGVAKDSEDYIAIGSKCWLEGSKEDRQIAAEMRRILDFLGLRPPDSGGIMGGMIEL